MKLERLLYTWKHTPQIAENFTAWRTIPARHAEFSPFPEDLSEELKIALLHQGIHALYSHQARSYAELKERNSIVLVTGTASGKSLGYNLPVLDWMLKNPSSRALYLFPTKALAQDQLSHLQALLHNAAKSQQIPVATYDGDTPQAHRANIRKNARIIFTNPDMLHSSILPHHTQWAGFFEGLCYVILDEAHTYRGVFGSHVANLIRRLRRVAHFYHSKPTFSLTSATIANPVELATRLTEEPVVLINQDTSARGEKHVLIYNPPIINQDLGIRRSAMQESVYLAGDLLAYDIQLILFARTRRSVELTLTYLRDQDAVLHKTNLHIYNRTERIRAYRSGYLAQERRQIEQGLRDGTVRAVVATNALELGIDIGGMEAVILAGYPGSFAATWQQAGRSGRGLESSISVFIANSSPIDQFLAQHPEYFFGRSPELAIINPDNLLILLDHIRCAAFELPFQKDEGFGKMPEESVRALLDFLVQARVLHLVQERYYWVGGQYPAQGVSLRNASAQRVLLMSEGQTIGEVDGESATWMVHPQAVYLHEGQMYFVESLDLEQNQATLKPASLDYYTEPVRSEEVRLRQMLTRAEIAGGEKFFGEVRVTTTITGFKRIQWDTRQRLDHQPLDLPPKDLETTACWITVKPETMEGLRDAGLWNSDPNDYGPNWNRQREAARQRDGHRCQVCGVPEAGRTHDVHHRTPFRTFPSWREANVLDNLITLCPACHRQAENVVKTRTGLGGLGYILGNLAPLYVMCDPQDIGVTVDMQSRLFDDGNNAQPAVIFFDRIPAGIGLTERLFEVLSALLERAAELINECPCKDGCPSCVGPGGELGAGSKKETQALLNILG